MNSKPLTVAVTGMSAGYSPAPGVGVIRTLREGAGRLPLRIIGLSYDPLDPGNYLQGIADQVFLIPYPSQGVEVMYDTLAAIHSRAAIDVLLPTLDAELPALVTLQTRLGDLGIHSFLPRAEELRLRSKARLGELPSLFGIRVPRSVVVSDSSESYRLGDELGWPLVVKGQFYEAQVVCSVLELESQIRRLRDRWGWPVIVQEHIPGEEYDVAAVGDGAGGLVGSVAMRKMQLSGQGKAWGGVTIADRDLDRFVTGVVGALGWRGPCELEVMRSPDGACSLIEINPRFPAWIYLAVGAGRNLPWAAVRLALGETVPPMPPTPAGIMFLRHSCDQICALSDFESLVTRGELSHIGGV